jgi:hypothetical protein
LVGGHVSSNAKQFVYKNNKKELKKHIYMTLIKKTIKEMNKSRQSENYLYDLIKGDEQVFYIIYFILIFYVLFYGDINST